MRIYIYANDVPNWHKRDYLISRWTSTVAKFRIPIEICEISVCQNKALINAFYMSAPLADDVQTSPAQVHGAKVQQILHIYKCIRIFLEKLDIHLCISKKNCNFAGQICI